MPRILFENELLIALDKPAGLIVHRDGRTEEPSVAEWLIERFPALAEVGEPWLSPQGECIAVAGLVHRLDRSTSGVLLAAKTDTAHDALKRAFKERRVEKTYRALVHAHMDAQEGRIAAEVIRSSDPPKRWYARTCDADDTRASITDWTLLENFSLAGRDVAGLEVKPRTGRTHQIRVHFAHAGHPLVGDHLYANDLPMLGSARPMLHAARIKVELLGEKIDVAASLPADLGELFDSKPPSHEATGREKAGEE